MQIYCELFKYFLSMEFIKINLHPFMNGANFCLQIGIFF
jgi:hypothetical protein